MNILVLNAGNASLKFEVIALASDARSASQGKKLVSGILEGIGGKGTLSVLNGKDVVGREEAAAKDYHDGQGMCSHG
jgi:acetate kinase